jgi:hypothetical protein
MLKYYTKTVGQISPSDKRLRLCSNTCPVRLAPFFSYLPRIGMGRKKLIAFCRDPLSFEVMPKPLVVSMLRASSLQP